MTAEKDIIKIGIEIMFFIVFLFVILLWTTINPLIIHFISVNIFYCSATEYACRPLNVMFLFFKSMKPLLMHCIKYNTLNQQLMSALN